LEDFDTYAALLQKLKKETWLADLYASLFEAYIQVYLFLLCVRIFY
jgi:hypothetical protein